MPPPQFKLANVAKDVLELPHRTNDQIREFEDVDVTSAKLRNVARTVAAKGGSREVAFTVGAGLLAGLGVPGATTLAARGGVRIRVVGTISSPGKGQQVSVTFRIGGGGELKLGDGVFEASGNASIGRERDFKVKWHRYSYVVRTARAAQDVAALDALMHPGPAGGVAAQVPRFGDVGPQAVRKALEQRFEEAVADADGHGVVR